MEIHAGMNWLSYYLMLISITSLMANQFVAIGDIVLIFATKTRPCGTQHHFGSSVVQGYLCIILNQQRKIINDWWKMGKFQHSYFLNHQQNLQWQQNASIVIRSKTACIFKNLNLLVIVISHSPPAGLSWSQTWCYVCCVWGRLAISVSDWNAGLSTNTATLFLPDGVTVFWHFLLQ